MSVTASAANARWREGECIEGSLEWCGPDNLCIDGNRRRHWKVNQRSPVIAVIEKGGLSSSRFLRMLTRADSFLLPSPMPTVSCNPNALVITLNLTAGQKLRHTLSKDASVTWVLTDAGANVLLAQGPAPKTRDWPIPPDPAPPPGGRTSHSLAITFGVAGKLRWKVEIIPAGGPPQLEKDCTYEGEAGEVYFDAVELEII